MKKNRILTESQKKQIIDDKQKNIIENFANVFNKIKRLNENELSNELPEEAVEFMILLGHGKKIRIVYLLFMSLLSHYLSPNMTL